MSRQSDRLTDVLIEEARVRGRLRGTSAAIAWMTVAIVMAVGAVEVSSGRASLGLVLAAVVAVRQLTGPVRSLGNVHEYYRRADISRRKILDFLTSRSRPYAAPGADRLRIHRGRIEFRGVRVEGAVDGIDLVAEPRQVVAIVGPVGAGKSTLLGLVARLVEPTEGQVLIDGQELAACTLRASHRQISMVGPDLPLMRGTLRRNIAYRNPRIPEAEVRRVVSATGLEELVGRSPTGLDSWVTEGGANLSTGERQRVALARALLGNPRILLLDEPTTNLDPDSRRVFQEIIRRHHGTVLLVTHDSEEAALADQVWQMEGGRCVEVLSGDEFRDRQWRYGLNRFPALAAV
jgi:ATP-binding cassette, subfamily B, bacterial